MPRRLAGFVALALLFCLSSITSAQTPPAGPPRDPRKQPAVVGTAVIRGRVFAADTNRPLRRARIQVSAPELGAENRTTSTDAEGKYEIKELPAGRYTLS